MKHRIQLFVSSLGILFVCAFAGKVQFALEHQELHESLGVFELTRTLVWGWKFDLAIAATFTLLSYLAALSLHLITRARFTPLLSATTVISVVSLLLLHGSDTLYYAEAGRHMGYELKETFNSGAALMLSAATTYFQALVIQLILITAAIIATAVSRPPLPDR